MGRLLAVLLWGTTGCAQIAGLDETSGIEPVSLSFERLSIGASLLRTPQDLTGHAASYLVADDTALDGLTRIPAELVEPHRWSAPIYTAVAPPVMFTLPDGVPRIWAMPGRSVAGLLAVLEHPNPTAAPAPATLTVQVDLPTPFALTERFELYTVGAWNRKPLTAPPLGGELVVGPETYDYATSLSLHGRPLEQITVDDAPLVLRYDGAALTAFLAAPAFAQTGTDTISGALTPVVLDQTLAVQIDPAAAMTRFGTLVPAMTAFSMDWALRASPGAADGFEAGPTLHGGTIAPTDPAELTVSYGNPFAARGWGTTFALAASASRVYTDPAGATVTLSANITQLLPGDSVGMAALIDLPVGVPEGITLGAEPLITDGQQIAAPTTAIPVSFTTTMPTNTLYEVTLYEHTLDPEGTGFTRTAVLAAAGTAPSFLIPPELFQAGKQYNLRASVVAGGYTTIADGDLTNRPLPLTRAVVDGPVFTVTP